jgi:hypothetical protein
VKWIVDITWHDDRNLRHHVAIENVEADTPDEAVRMGIDCIREVNRPRVTQVMVSRSMTPETAPRISGER